MKTKEKILYLPMKKHWFDMILSGKKKEEYRLMSPHWISRLEKVSNCIYFNKFKKSIERDGAGWTVTMDVPFQICFVNGYSKQSPRFLGRVRRFHVRGKSLHPEWGEDGYAKQAHFAFCIDEIERISNVKR